MARNGGDSGPDAITPQAYSRDCVWYLHSDSDLVNIAYPDTAANYWAGRLLIPPGGEVRITGEFPHARYMSFNVYDETLSSFGAIADRDIIPDDGSVNPMLPGAQRDDGKRRYTLRLVSDPPPKDPGQREPNTLYAGRDYGSSFYGSLIYRVYVADRDTSLAGNVDLPSVTYVFPGGQELSSPQSCAFIEQTRLGLGINDAITGLRGIDEISARAGSDPLTWTKFVGFGPTAVSILQELPPLADLPLDDAWNAINKAVADGGVGTSGGFLSNRDNAYVSATVNHDFGEIAVISAKAPTTPRTYANASTMQPSQLRYWSLCTNDIYTQRFYDCAYDEEAPLDRSQNYTIVISTSALRPANARPECGVAWLNWGPRADSLLILRNMLPSSDFHQAVQDVPKLSGDELAVMGDFYPVGWYTSRSDFEALSTDPAGDASSCRVDVATSRAEARARLDASMNE